MAWIRCSGEGDGSKMSNRWSANNLTSFTGGVKSRIPTNGKACLVYMYCPGASNVAYKWSAVLSNDGSINTGLHCTGGGAYPKDSFFSSFTFTDEYIEVDMPYIFTGRSCNVYYFVMYGKDILVNTGYLPFKQNKTYTISTNKKARGIILSWSDRSSVSFDCICGVSDDKVLNFENQSTYGILTYNANFTDIEINLVLTNVTMNSDVSGNFVKYYILY